jgi:hypothetical protein
MASFRNDWAVPRICPTLGFHEVDPGGTITVPDDEIEHWVAGSWTPADPATAKAAEDAATARAAAFAALTAPAPPTAAPTEPAVTETAADAPAKPTKDSAAPAPEGKQP